MRYLQVFPVLLLGFGCGQAQEIHRPLLHVAFTPDGKWLVAGGGTIDTRKPLHGGHGVVKVWETANWKPYGTWTDGFTDTVDHLFVQSKDSFAVASSKIIPDSRGSPYAGVLIRSWRFSDKLELPARHLESPLSARGIGYHFHEKLVAYSHGKNAVVFTLPKLERKSVLEGHSNGSLLLHFSPDGKSILSCTVDKPFIRLHDVSTGKRVGEQNVDGIPPEFSFVHARFSSDGKMISVGTESKKVFVLTADLSAVLFEIGVQYQPTLAEISPNNEFIAIMHSSDAVRLYNIKTKEPIRTFEGNLEGVNGCCFSPDGAWIAIASGGHPRDNGTSPGRVRIFEVKTGKLLGELD
jgi:WD40 repeat protein